MNVIDAALAIDLMTLIGAAFLLFKYGRLSFMHPAVFYLLFHLWVITKRLVEVALGSPPSVFFSHQPVTDDELVRASLMFDVVLASMSAAWLRAASVDLRRNGPLPTPEALNRQPRTLAKAYVIGVAVLMIPLGMVGLATGHGKSSGGSDWDNSFATMMLQLWLPLAFMPLFYWYGPRKRLLVAFVFVGFFTTLLGQPRWLLLLPAIFFSFSYLCRQGRAWPPAKTAALLAVAGLIWLPLKQVGGVLRSGGDMATVLQTAAETWTSSTTKSDSPDTQFLDMSAITVGLVDNYHQFFYGGTIAPAFVNFIPRPLWPDKPMPYQYMYDISTKDRPMGAYTMSPTIMGAAYADFGYVGVVLMPFGFAYFLGWLYFRAFRCSYFSSARFVYLVMACELIQPYRDGIYSFFIFNFVYMMPLMVIPALNSLFPIRPKLRTRLGVSGLPRPTSVLRRN